MVTMQGGVFGCVSTSDDVIAGTSPGADPTGADPTGADPTGADPTGADPTGGAA
jgi:hypothetical protein